GSEKLFLCEVFISVKDSELLSGYIRTYVFVRFSSPCSHREMYSPEQNSKTVMANKFLDKVEDNAIVRIWSKKMQLEKGDSLAKRYVSELWDYTMEEYTALLHCPRLQVDKTYSRAAYVPAFWKKLMNITRMSEPWITAKIKQKGECKCIPWKNLRDLILAHPDGKKKVDVFALSIYELVIFPRALGHVDEAVLYLFDRLDKGVTPIPAILVETFRSLNVCRRAGEGRFIGCAQLLLAWFHSHF
ncbi:hypothetical protein Golax_020463, partial [Gossypium laxum]|nr:hypothetical protein [Gossypium laxum]